MKKLMRTPSQSIKKKKKKAEHDGAHLWEAYVG
jgi:hypothetical protein